MIDVSGDYPAEKMPVFIEAAKSIRKHRGCGAVDCLDCPAKGIYHGGVNCISVKGDWSAAEAQAWFAAFLAKYEKTDIDHQIEEHKKAIAELEARKQLKTKRFPVLDVVESTQVPIITYAEFAVASGVATRKATPAEALALVDLPPSRYNWYAIKALFPWAEWAATDKDGRSFTSENKPQRYSDSWYADGMSFTIGVSNKCPGWRDSLEQCPEWARKLDGRA